MRFISSRLGDGALQVLVALTLFPLVVFAQGAPKPDVNIIGPTKDPLDIRDEGLKQQVEPACAMRPGDGDCIICFYIDYRTVDIFEHQDAWIGMSESCDAGDTWTSRITPGSPSDLQAPIGTKFAADPRAIALPGITIHGFIGGFRDQDSGVIAVQHWLENNKEDFDYNEPARDTIIVDQGTEGRFIDKPEFHFKMDEGTPQDTVTLSFVMENPELGTLGTITREFPAGTLYAAYAVFTGSQSVKLLVKRSNDLGKTWTNQTKKLTESQNLVSGITMTSLGNLTMAMWRQVQDINDIDAIYYATTTNGGNKWSKPKLLTNICRFDQPSATQTSPVPLATFRTNDFPWLASDGTNIYAFYTERVGGCATGTPKVFVRHTSNGNSWGQAQQIDESIEAGPGAQFMPAAFGARGKVQVAWYDTRRENFPFDPAIPFIADHIPTTGVLINRKIDVYTARITPAGNTIDISEAARVSHYRTVREPGDLNGPAYEIEASFSNAKMYSSGFLAFIGDYLAVTAQEFRPDGSGGWQENQSPIPGDPNLTDFFVAYADNRDVRGNVLFDGSGSSNTYTPSDNVEPMVGADAGQADSIAGEMLADSDNSARKDESRERRSTEGLDDTFVDPATECVLNQDRTRDANIYGAVIRDELRLSTPVASRPLSGILRAIPFLARDVTTDTPPPPPAVPPTKPYRLYIANQPGVAFQVNRASFRQLPAVGPFPSAPALVDLIENVDIQPNSVVARTVFLVSPDIAATVNVEIYEGGCATAADSSGDDFTQVCAVLGSITLGGGGTAGSLQQPDYLSNQCIDNLGNPVPEDCDVSVTELHNPLLENPLLENPLLENPLLENPLLENMELENPLLENPLLENVGYENPLLENPLLENPLLENPLLENPLLENPLLENPLLENTAFTGGELTYADMTAVVRNDGNVTTAYNFDATAANFTGTAGGTPVAQIILWKQYATGTSRDCEYRPEVRNQVITTINQPDNILSDATIDDPFAGEASMILAPGEQGFVTYRVFGTDLELAPVRLSGLTASSQAANCDEFDDDQVGPGPGEDPIQFYECKDQLDDGVEKIFFQIDTIPPTFNTPPGAGDTIPDVAVEANAPGGACVDPAFVSGLLSATDNEGAIVTITCVNAEGDEICDAIGGTGLSIPVSTFITQPDPPGDELGPAPITCTASDEIGNSDSIDLFFDVDDTLPPLFDPIPVFAPVAADDVTGDAIVDFEAGITGFDQNDVDPDPVISCETSTGLTKDDPLPIGDNNVTCTITDSSGNSSETMFAVTVEDVTAPVISVANDVTAFLDAFGNATVTYTSPAVTDNDPAFAATTASCLPSSGSAFLLGDNDVTCTATDPAGNSSQVVFTVSVVDNIGPMISDPPDVTAFLDASGVATVTYSAPIATDNDPAFPPTMASCMPASGSAFSLGDNDVTCTATDASGNMSQVTFTVTVEDNIGPVISDPPDITAFLDASGITFVTYTSPSVTDNDPAFPPTTASCTPASGTAFSLGDTNVTCTATDLSGNASQVMFTVTVVDNIGPVITVSDDIFAIIENSAGAIVAFPAPTATDASGIQSVTCDAMSGSTFPPGETIVTCTATDNAGNMSSDSFTINVGYGGGIGIFANKYNVKGGSSNQLRWAWQDEFGNNIDSSGDDQLLRIVDCDDPMIVVFEMAGDPGSSGFRFKSDNSWEFNWQTDDPNTGAPLKGLYCPSVESDLTGDMLLIDRPIKVR